MRLLARVRRHETCGVGCDPRKARNLLRSALGFNTSSSRETGEVTRSLCGAVRCRGVLPQTASAVVLARASPLRPVSRRSEATTSAVTAAASQFTKCQLNLSLCAVQALLDMNLCGLIIQPGSEPCTMNRPREHRKRKLLGQGHFHHRHSPSLKSKRLTCACPAAADSYAAVLQAAASLSVGGTWRYWQRCPLEEI